MTHAVTEKTTVDALGTQLLIEMYDCHTDFFDNLEWRSIRRGLGTRQGKQLLRQVCGSIHAGTYLAQCMLYHGLIGLALGVVGLGLDTGERRTQLMRGVGDETLLCGDRFRQSSQHVVDGV